MPRAGRKKPDIPHSPEARRIAKGMGFARTPNLGRDHPGTEIDPAMEQIGKGAIRRRNARRAKVRT